MSPDVIEGARSQIRASRKPAPQRPAWKPLELSGLRLYLPVLAFDASLANTGWVVMFAMEDRVHVQCHGTIRPQSPDDGYMGTWRRAAELRDALLASSAFLAHRRTRGLIAVEAPPVGAGYRKESSLVAGFMVYQTFPGVAVVSPTHVSAVLLGDPRIRSGERKKRIKDEVCRLIPEAAGRDWNEHERDAASVGFVMLHDLKEKTA